jgi:hypothetical protein
LQNSRRFELTQHFFLLAFAAFHVELQTNMLAGASTIDILHEAVMALKNVVDFVADLLDAFAGHFVALEQYLEIQRLFEMAEHK